jgi:lysophospholipase L1-like esterase
MRRVALLAAIVTLVIAAGASAKTLPLDYVALGDSVASGHGLMDRGGACRRSPRAYPRVALAALRQRHPSVRFALVACTGATATGDLAGQVGAALAFLRQRAGRPALVTITVGINDFDWANIPATYVRLRDPDQNAFEAWVDGIAADVSRALRSQLGRLLRRPSVRVVLTEYPNPVNPSSLLFGPPQPCADPAVCYARTELVVHELNEALGRLASRRVRIARIHEAFHGHEAPSPDCGSGPPTPADTWFQYPSDPDSNSFPAPPPFTTIEWRGDCFHPNARGAAEIATAVARTAKALGR